MCVCGGGGGGGSGGGEGRGRGRWCAVPALFHSARDSVAWPREVSGPLGSAPMGEEELRPEALATGLCGIGLRERER